MNACTCRAAAVFVMASVLVVAPKSYASSMLTDDVRSVVAHAFADRHEIRIELLDGHSYRGRIIAMSDTDFRIRRNDHAAVEISYASVSSAKTSTRAWIVVAIGAAVVVTLLVLRSQCFYRC